MVVTNWHIHIHHLHICIIKQVFPYLFWIRYIYNHSLLSQMNTKPNVLAQLINAIASVNRIFRRLAQNQVTQEVRSHSKVILLLPHSSHAEVFFYS